MTEVRYEILPFASADQVVASAVRPLTLTVTCSPKHGPDRTVEVACRLAGLGHCVIAHVAARMVKSQRHMQEIVARLETGGIHDLFIVGGDAAEPGGPYTSGLALLAELRESGADLRSVGAPAYPAGHPLITEQQLAEDLALKRDYADYFVTQMCFDVDRVVAWLGQLRDEGVTTPVFVGAPGAVDRKRLLEISMKVGVGPSVAYLRKSHGITRLFSHGGVGSATSVLRRLEPALAGPLGVAGLQMFTFNRLTETARLVENELGCPGIRASKTPALGRGA